MLDLLLGNFIAWVIIVDMHNRHKSKKFDTWFYKRETATQLYQRIITNARAARGRH